MGPSVRRKIYIVLRLVLLLYVAVVLARFVSSQEYASYYSKVLLRIHTDMKTSQKTNLLPATIASLLESKDTQRLQETLDQYYSIFALVITDCRGQQSACPEQKVLFTTSQNLLSRKLPGPDELPEYPFIVLLRPQAQSGTSGQPREIIGRLYTISTIPTSFVADYRAWLKDPFADYGPWKHYLAAMVNCLLGGILTWLVVELFLKIRWIERRNAVQRERVLIKNADSYLRQLEEKENQIAEQEERMSGQFETYIRKIRELEQKLQHDLEYRKMAESIINSIEEEKQQQLVKYRAELDKTNQEKLALRAEVAKYQRASGKEKAEASRALESAISPQFSNVFEQKVFDAITGTAKCQAGSWLVRSHFDVAVGKGGSQFIDCIVISKDCMMVIETKNYSGTIAVEGDVENNRWYSRSRGGKDVEVKSSWGINPYHQVREYTMSLLTIVNTRSQWHIPLYGVIVFPEGTDIAALGDRIGKFYRMTTADRLLGVIENIDAEARRDNAHTRRPSPRQVEDLILGRNVDISRRR